MPPIPLVRITALAAVFKRARKELQKYATKKGMTEKEALHHLVEKVKKRGDTAGKRAKK
ncbi:MAG: hypothetical protein WBQ48_08560 [Aeromicrobium sp.]